MGDRPWSQSPSAGIMVSSHHQKSCIDCVIFLGSGRMMTFTVQGDDGRWIQEEGCRATITVTDLQFQPHQDACSGWMLTPSPHILVYLGSSHLASLMIFLSFHCPHHPWASGLRFFQPLWPYDLAPLCATGPKRPMCLIQEANPEVRDIFKLGGKWTLTPITPQLIPLPSLSSCTSSVSSASCHHIGLPQGTCSWVHKKLRRKRKVVRGRKHGRERRN